MLDPRSFDECCALLDVPRAATAAEIRSAYRLLVRVWHPDRFAHDPALQARASEKLKTINLAYRRLEAAGFRSGSGPVSRPQASGPVSRPKEPTITFRMDATRSGPVRARWQQTAPHPNLVGSSGRLALAGLLAGRALSALGARRYELLMRIEEWTEEMLAGQAVMRPLPLRAALDDGTMLDVWPRALSEAPASPLSSQEPLSLVCTLEGVIVPRLGLLEPGAHLQATLALATVAGLSRLLSGITTADRARLGRLLRGVTGYYSAPSESFAAGSETLAVLAQLAVLAPLVAPAV